MLLGRSLPEARRLGMVVVTAGGNPFLPSVVDCSYGADGFIFPLPV